MPDPLPKRQLGLRQWLLPVPSHGHCLCLFSVLFYCLCCCFLLEPPQPVPQKNLLLLGLVLQHQRGCSGKCLTINSLNEPKTACLINPGREVWASYRHFGWTSHNLPLSTSHSNPARLSGKEMLHLWLKWTLLQGHCKFTWASWSCACTHTLILHSTLFSSKYVVVCLNIPLPHLLRLVSKNWYKLFLISLAAVFLQESEQSAMIVTHSQGVWGVLQAQR